MNCNSFHRLRGIFFLSTLIFFLQGTRNIYADILFYKNQQYIVGKVVGTTADSIELKVGDKVTTIPKNLILKIIYQKEAEQKYLQEEADKHAESIRAALRKEKEERDKQIELEKQEKAAEEKKKADEKEKENQRIRNEKASVETKYDWIALKKSAIFPGNGQRYQGNEKSGKIFSGLFIFGGVSTFYFYYNGYKSNREYHDSNSPLAYTLIGGGPGFFLNIQNHNHAQDELRRFEQGFQISLLFTMSVYFANLYDVRFLKTAASVISNSSSGWSLGLRPDHSDLANGKLYSFVYRIAFE